MKRTLAWTAALGIAAVAMLPACAHHRGHRCGHHGAEDAGPMEEHHRRLAELVHRMNTSTGPEKVDATAAVVNELVHHGQAKHGRTCRHHAK